MRVEIPRMYFEVLRKWASVGRTIDAATNLIEEACGNAELNEPFKDPTRFIDQANFTLQELGDLKQPLSACGAACLTTHMAAEVKAAKSLTEAVLVIGDEPALYFKTEQQAGFAFGVLLGLGIRLNNPIHFVDKGRFRVGFRVPIPQLLLVVDAVNDRLSELFEVFVASASEKWWE